MTFIVFFYFLENYKNYKIERFNLVIVLILFMLYVKTTTLVFILIPLLLLVKNFKNIKSSLSTSIPLSILILSVFIAKNVIICGSPVFPFKIFQFLTTVMLFLIQNNIILILNLKRPRSSSINKNITR